ncbi:GDSL esterase/lipase [Camellia lanceoleosa]|uniref:GDSL esterase/lipase n=1 Tax=Camellia lanceoleosa TaxID=1840588 RepID=A0ACC0G5U1_9ERIC|nr:GDSL esterase/lipase [Camellia lanceoleosa]
MDTTIIIRRWKGPWTRRKTVEATTIGVTLLAAFWVFTATNHRTKLSLQLQGSNACPFPAIFNFGDSNSDTGCVSALFGRLSPPNGRTFFGKPSGRYSDGRLIIDFMAEKLGLPYLNAYLDSVESNFRHGANFAASGSTIKPVPSMNPIHLTKSSYAQSSLPRPEDLSKALYTMDTGQSDLYAGLTSMTEEQKLYLQGARAFWIHNTGPIGCLPYFVVNYPPKPGNADQIGCVKSYNEVAQEFNKQLKDTVSQLRTKFQDALLIYVDIYSVKYSLISEAKEHGFVDPLGYCCGHHGDCWERTIVNGTEVNRDSCSNPSEYISWDKIHYTEAANNWLRRRQKVKAAGRDEGEGRSRWWAMKAEGIAMVCQSSSQAR